MLPSESARKKVSGKQCRDTVLFTAFHILRAVHLQTIEGIFLAGLFPWHFSFIVQYTLERFRADGERIRRDKGRAPGANPHRGLQARMKILHM